MSKLGDKLDTFRLLCASLGLLGLTICLRGARGALGAMRARMGLGLRRALPRLWRLGLLDWRLGLLDFEVRVETILGAFLFLYTSAELHSKIFDHSTTCVCALALCHCINPHAHWISCMLKARLKSPYSLKGLCCEPFETRSARTEHAPCRMWGRAVWNHHTKHMGSRANTIGSHICSMFACLGHDTDSTLPQTLRR